MEVTLVFVSLSPRASIRFKPLQTVQVNWSHQHLAMASEPSLGHRTGCQRPPQRPPWCHWEPLGWALGFGESLMPFGLCWHC